MMGKGELRVFVILVVLSLSIAAYFRWMGDYLKPEDEYPKLTIFCTAEDYHIQYMGTATVDEGIKITKVPMWQFRGPAFKRDTYTTLAHGFNRIFENDPSVRVVNQFKCPEDMNSTPWTVWK
jgi:hypothetical protein